MPPFNIEIQSHDGKTFGAYLAKANKANAPVLLVIQEIFGVNESMRAMCDNWAREGYHAICPDIFWRQQPGVELTDKTPAEWQQAIAYMNGMDLELCLKDLQSTLKQARAMPGTNGRIGTMGFCLGGKLAYLMAARSDANCNISYYGVGLTELLNEVPNIKNPLLMHFAENDKYLNGDALQNVRDAVAKNPRIESYVYAGVEHAFSRINGEHFDADAAKKAFERSTKFLDVNLSTPL
ncbi:MAG: dienelactone hydrolase family protein [Alphaproteobacteria bacterium]|nr:dienelactone hydrolase family protein [Alphaproteobacteria bacterium]